MAPLRSGITGLESSIQILPTLVGGASLTNVPLLVIDDRNLRIGPVGSAYQNAILGYPTLRALGTVTFTAGGEFIAGALGSRREEGRGAAGVKKALDFRLWALGVVGSRHQPKGVQA